MDDHFARARAAMSAWDPLSLSDDLPIDEYDDLVAVLLGNDRRRARLEDTADRLVRMVNADYWGYPEDWKRAEQAAELVPILARYGFGAGGEP